MSTPDEPTAINPPPVVRTVGRHLVVTLPRPPAAWVHAAIYAFLVACAVAGWARPAALPVPAAGLPAAPNPVPAATPAPSPAPEPPAAPTTETEAPIALPHDAPGRAAPPPSAALSASGARPRACRTPYVDRDGIATPRPGCPDVPDDPTRSRL